MTSTNFNIGLDDGRNSSRVLKPPGGGHTDIFGIKGDNELSTPSKKKNQQSTLSGCFTQGNVKETDEVDQKNGNVAVDENTKPIVDKKEEQKNDEPGSATKRARVPPGGYSAGFW